MIDCDLDTRIAVAMAMNNGNIGYLKTCEIFGCSTADLSRMRRSEGKFRTVHYEKLKITQLRAIAQIRGTIVDVAKFIGVINDVVIFARKNYLLDD